MPRSSSRQKLLRRVKGVLEKREESALIRELLSDKDSGEDDLDMSLARMVEIPAAAIFALTSSAIDVFVSPVSASPPRV
ncbi:hypothetical protein P3T76_016297 [Phytophthora citrophthora]|uniref:Uncharacterized protein n=1 Tax=Phytophthora citrophthora TaxID=4793 RepID=A0AAD9FYA1_9STRA|nr:hypothetical protein P3T76_016297 [Phytophthora citrophthora]